MFGRSSDGDHGYGAGLLIVIVLVVLFAAFSRNWGGWGDGGGHRDGGGYAMPYPVYGGGPGWGRYGVEGVADAMAIHRSTDAGYAHLSKEVCADTGKVIHDIDIQACATREKIGEEGRRAEERSYRAEIDRKNDELAKERLANAELKGVILQKETVSAVQASNCELNHRLDRIECEMLKRPPVYPEAYLPAMQRCGHHEPVREVIREVRTEPPREILVHAPREVFVRDRRPEFFDGRRDGRADGFGDCWERAA